MNNKQSTRRDPPRSKAVILTGVLLSLALASLLLISAGGSVGASTDLPIDVTPTGEGGLVGNISGSGSASSTAVVTVASQSTTDAQTTTQPNENATSTPVPTATKNGNGNQSPTATATVAPQSGSQNTAPPTKTPRPSKNNVVVNDKKITICHATDSATTPYVLITVSVNGLNGHNLINHPGDLLGEYNRATGEYSGVTECPQPTPPPANQFKYTCQVGNARDSSTNDKCTDGFYGTDLLLSNGTWWTVDTFCMTKDQCTKADTTIDKYGDLPCTPVMTPGGITLQCKGSPDIQTWNLSASVNTSCPINEVQRSPYPRSLVNLPTTFMLQQEVYNTVDGIASAPQSPANLNDFVDANGNPNEYGYLSGIWKDLRLIMRSHRFAGGETWFGQTVPKSQWVFEDRSWNTGPYAKTQEGNQATYVYQTSSAGMTNQLGREFDTANKTPSDVYDLPAYGVSVTSFCGHEWKVTAKLAARTWHPSGACYQSILYPDGSTYAPPGTANDGCAPGWVAPGTYTYSWEDYTTDWAGVDLTKAGRSTSYDKRTLTTSGGMWQDTVYWDEPTGIWVPVVEVQSVLRNSCVASGQCAPPSAQTLP